MAQSSTQAPLDVFIGRQPIYDRQLRLFAHELLFRSSHENSAEFDAPDKATSQLLIHSMLDIGLNQIAGDLPVFVNLTEEVILNGVALILPPGRCVLEILESVRFTPEVLTALQDLKDREYKLALDDFVYGTQPAAQQDAALELADFVKLDVQSLSTAELENQLNLVRPFKVATLAEKIESMSEFRTCCALGFDHFQGYFLSRPEVLPGKSPAVDILAMTLLLERCLDPMACIPAVAKLVAQNASLSYRLLQAANSALHARKAEIGSVQEAVLFLGIGFVSKIATLFLLSGLGDKPSFALVLALQRACMCELLGNHDAERSQLYMVGLLSALDFLLDQPILSIIDPLPIADEVKTAIVTRDGTMGRVLGSVLAYEIHDWKTLGEDPENAAAVSRAYWSTLPQVEQMQKLIETVGRASAKTKTTTQTQRPGLKHFRH